MDPKQKQNAAKSQASKSGSGSAGSYPEEGKKKKKGAGGGIDSDVDAVAGAEETPITMSGGSIIVEFAPDFDDDSAPVASGAPGKKVKKVKSPPSAPGLRFTRVVIRRGRGGPILNEYPPQGVELGKGCIIEIKGQR